MHSLDRDKKGKVYNGLFNTLSTQSKSGQVLITYSLGASSDIMPPLGIDIGSNFNIHIWACPGDFIVRNRWTGNITVMHTTKLEIRNWIRNC